MLIGALFQSIPEQYWWLALLVAATAALWGFITKVVVPAQIRRQESALKHQQEAENLALDIARDLVADMLEFSRYDMGKLTEKVDHNGRVLIQMKDQIRILASEIHRMRKDGP